MAKADLAPLTGLRGAAAVWVAAYHVLLPGALIGGVAARIVGRGYLAVDLFFVLSGFLLARAYGAELTGPRLLAAWPAFVWRRWGRIFPLYGLILVARLGYTAWAYGTFDLPRAWIAAPSAHPWADIPANLLLVQSWHAAPSLIGPAWSVSTEWAAYWAFPLLAIVLLRGRPGVALAAVAGASLLVLAAASRHGSLDAWDGRTWGPMLRCLGGFSLGMGLWRLSRWCLASGIAASPLAGWTVALALLLGFACGWPDLALYPLLPALVMCLACGQGGLGRWLAAAPALWLGEVSYAFYLLHIFLLHPLDQARAAAALVLPAWAADTLAAGMLLTLLLAAAELAHRWVERPARNWAAGLVKAAPPRPPAARSFLTHPAPPPRNLPLPAPRGLLPWTADALTSRTVR